MTEGLEVQSLRKTFGGLVALRDVSITLERSCVNALIGPNGSGKTTLINLVTKVYSPDSGKILFRGERIDTLPAHMIAGKGIMRTFQVVKVFGHMSVVENVMCGAQNWIKSGLVDGILQLPRMKREEAEVRQEAMGALGTVGLEHLADSLAGSLPLGHQRMLELARALAGKPQLLLLDEPVSGLNPQERELMESKILELCGRGITILLVEHEMKTVMRLARKIVVLNFGEILAQGTPEEIRNSPEVIEAYLGREGQNAAAG